MANQPGHNGSGHPTIACSGYQTASALVQQRMDAEAVLSTMEDSGLRFGRRGLSGRPRKWHRARPAAPRLMAVNIDEDEPSTFKDRYYLGATRTAFWKACSSPPGGGHRGRLYLPARQVPRLPRVAAICAG